MSDNSDEPNTSETTTERERTEQGSQNEKSIQKETKSTQEKLTEAITATRAVYDALQIGANAKITKNPAAALCAQLKPVLQLLEAFKGDTFQRHVFSMLMDLEEKVEKTNANVTEMGKKVDAADTLMKSSASTLTNIEKRLATDRQQLDDSTKAVITSSSNPLQTRSYSAVVQATSSRTEDPRALARQLIRNRQILFDYPKDFTDYPSITTTKELIMEAVRASEPKEEWDTKLITWTKLNNGGVLFELASEEAVRNIMDTEAGRKKFEEAYGRGIKLQLRTFTVIVQTVPLCFDPSSPDTQRAWESGNGFPEGSIIEAKWIKKAHMRSPHQKVAYVRLRTNREEIAIKMKAEGLIIDGKRVPCMDDHKEALTCIGCWRPNHYIRECKNPMRCGKCGGSHRAEECTETDTAKFFCVQCNQNGHASMDRMCPTFRRRCVQLDERTGIRGETDGRDTQKDSERGVSAEQQQKQWTTVGGGRGGEGGHSGFRGSGGFSSTSNFGRSDNGWRNKGTMGDATQRAPWMGRVGYMSKRPSPLRQTTLAATTSESTSTASSTPTGTTLEDGSATSTPTPTPSSNVGGSSSATPQ